MKRLRVLMIEWEVPMGTWGRIPPQISSITPYHNITFATSGPFEIKGIPCIEVPKPKGYYDDYKAMMSLAKDVVMWCPDWDVLYIRNGGPERQLLDVMISKLARKPCVMKVAGDNLQVRKYYPNGLFRFSMPELDALDRISLMNVDRFTPLTSTLRESTIEKGVDPYRVSEPIPLGVDCNLWDAGEPPEKLTVGYAGRIVYEKGFPWFTEVMKLTPEIPYRLSGNYEIELRLPDNCHFDGLYPYEDMPRWYETVSVVALPSYTEGLPNMLLEAYASGRPIIVSPEAHPPELPVFGWELPHDMDRWAKTLRGITFDEARMLGLEARDWLRRNWPSWDWFGRRMAEEIWKAHEESE